jgi:serine/threonine-protein kinase
MALGTLEAPALVPYEQVGLAEDQPYLVRRHLEAESLAHRLSGRGPLDVQTSVRVAIQLCEALAPLHRAGLVHGSLSPYSVWLAPAPEGDDASGLSVLVTDVGLMPALRPLQSTSDQPWGRSPYLTPEQVAGESVHPASDVYVIGSLFYAMLAGRPPFRSNEGRVLVLQHLRQEPPSLQVLVPEVSPPLADVVKKALAKEPAARYRNAGQLAHILRTQLRIPPAPKPSALPAVIMPPAARDQLVVPPPTRARRPAVQRVMRNYEFIEEEEWAEPREGTDWLLVMLFVAAILAVLGLVPLWRAVYERYSAPPALPAPTSLHVPTGRPGQLVQSIAMEERDTGCQQGILSAPPGDASGGWRSVMAEPWGWIWPGMAVRSPGPAAELDAGAVLWYNKEST